MSLKQINLMPVYDELYVLRFNGHCLIWLVGYWSAVITFGQVNPILSSKYDMHQISSSMLQLKSYKGLWDTVFLGSSTNSYTNQLTQDLKHLSYHVGVASNSTPEEGWSCSISRQK